jgi:raffinose/stachyose/melibiose transport system permease protein
MVITSLKVNMEITMNPLSMPSSFNINGYKKIFGNENFLWYVKNSMLVVIFSLSFSLLLALLLSYVLARYRGKVINSLYLFFLIGMIIPLRLGVLFLNDMFNTLGLLDSLLGLILIYIATSIPFAMFILTGYIRMIPDEIDESAFIDGCSSVQILSRMIVPLVKPAIFTITIYNFLPIWNDIYFPLIFIFDKRKKTFMLHVTMFFGQFQTDWNLVFSALTFATMVSLIFYALGSRYLVKGLTAGALKG